MKWIPWLTLFVVLSAGVAYALGRSHGYTKSQSKWAAVEKQMLEQAISMRDAYEKKLDESRQRVAVILADFDSARSTLGSLQSSAQSDVPADTRAAVDTAKVRGQLLAECGERYIEMAKTADIHANDAVTCHAAWVAIGESQ